MVDLRKETHGAGSMKGVNLAVISYDNRVARDKTTDKVTTHYLDARLHPEDSRAAGQTTLALVAKRDAKSPNGYNNSARYTASQFEAIKETAGDNVADLTNKDGEVVGKIYGVKADLIIAQGELIANTKTLSETELSVQPDKDGKDIRTRIFASMAESKEAREAAKAAEVETPEAPAAEAEAAKPATKAKTTRKPAAKKPVDLGVESEAAEASVDEPALG